MPAPYRIELSKQAAVDLDGIFQHIAQDSPTNAAKMVERVLAAIARLKTFPHRTVLPRQSARLKHPVRSLPVDSYIVYFRVIEEHRVVRVLLVRHGARRRPRRFG